MRYSTNFELYLYDIGDKWNHEYWNANISTIDIELNKVKEKTDRLNQTSASFTESVTAPDFIGNASSSTKLLTARSIQIGNQSLTFDGTSNLLYSLELIGASAVGHTHSYLPLVGGVLTGDVTTVNMIPDISGSRDLGSDGKWYRYMYAFYMRGQEIKLNGATDLCMIRSSDDVGVLYSNGNIYLRHALYTGFLTDILETKSNTAHTHSSIDYRGHVSGVTGSTLDTVRGLSFKGAYSDLNAYPTAYGNVLSLRGTGSNELYFQWYSNTTPVPCGMWVRNKRDIDGSDWAAWQQICVSGMDYDHEANMRITGNTYLNGNLYMRGAESTDYPVLTFYGANTSAGAELLIGARGNTYLGSGEASETMRTNMIAGNLYGDQSYNAQGERLYILSDGYVEIFVNLNDFANRKGMIITNSGYLRPYITNTCALGTNTYRFMEVNATSIKQAGNVVLDTSSLYAASRTAGGAAISAENAANTYFTIPSAGTSNVEGGELQLGNQNGTYWHIDSNTNNLRFFSDTGAVAIDMNYLTPKINLRFATQCHNTFTATTVYNAVWNDYAEYFERGEETEPGDIVALDLDSDVERYIKAICGLAVVGIHSDTYGHIVGGENVPEEYEGTFQEYNEPKFIPVGMTGRVRCKVTGNVKRGDKIYASQLPGVGMSTRCSAGGGGIFKKFLMLVSRARTIMETTYPASKCYSDNRKEIAL